MHHCLLMVDRVLTVGDCYMVLCDVASEEGGRKGEKKCCIACFCVCLNDGVLLVDMKSGEVMVACSSAI